MWEEVTAEKEKWGSRLRRGKANGKGESGRTDGPEGVDRKVLGGASWGRTGSKCGKSGTATEIWSSSVRTARVRPNGGELACKHGLEKGGTNTVSSRRSGCVTKREMV